MRGSSLPPKLVKISDKCASYGELFFFKIKTNDARYFNRVVSDERRLVVQLFQTVAFDSPEYDVRFHFAISCSAY